MLNSIIKGRISGIFFAGGLILITVVILYSHIYHAPFVFDDAGRIVENVTIKNPTNYLSFSQLLRPRGIVDLTFALNYRFGKLEVSGYHLVNIIIHLLNGLLVYFLALTILRCAFHFSQSSKTHPPPSSSIPLMSLFAALIFVAHPIQTQAVTYTVQRYASMAAFFYMASVLFYLKGRLEQEDVKPGKPSKENRRQVFVFYVFSAVSGLLAFLSKENAASLPGTIFLVEYLLLDRTWRGWKRRLPWFVSAFALWTFFVVLVLMLRKRGADLGALFEDVSGPIRETGRVGRWQYLCTQFNVIVIYIRLLFVPIHQNLDYAYAFKKGFFDGYTPLAFLFLTALIGVGIKEVRRRPVISLGIFWFFITLSVESSVIPIRDALFEHRLYLPMFGFSLIVSKVLYSIFSTKRFWAITISVIIVIALGTATFRRNKLWQDDVLLWADVVSKNPDNWRGHLNLGGALEKQGRTEKAIVQFLETLKIKPGNAFAHNNLGAALVKQGQTEKGIEHYLVALRIKPDYAFAHNNLGLALENQGLFDQAMEHYQEALRINPDYAIAHANLGNVLQRLGRVEEAIAQYAEALRIDPDYANAHYNFARALQIQGRMEEAIDHYLNALRIDPNNVEAYNNLGILFYQSGNIERAIAYFREALRINPGYSDARENLKTVLMLELQSR
jgi:tetratricopeptide (TPR) repeat protein